MCDNLDYPPLDTRGMLIDMGFTALEIVEFARRDGLDEDTLEPKRPHHALVEAPA
jgi:hypothetical protein